MHFRLTIFSKGLILVVLPLFLQIVFAGTVAILQRRQTEAQWWSSHTREVMSQGQTVHRMLLEEQSGVRGYVATGDPTFIDFYGSSTRELPAALGRLQELVADNAEQKANARQISVAAAAVYDWYGSIIVLMQMGNQEDALLRLKTREGKKQLDDLHNKLGEFIGNEQRLDRQREQALQTAQSWLRWSLLAGTIVSGLSVVSLGALFYRITKRRFAVLVENMHRLAKGEELLPQIGGVDEIAEIDRAFHATATRLQKTRQELEQQNRLLQLVVDTMSDGLAVTDADGEFLIYNPAAERIIGLRPGSLSPDEWPKFFGTYLPDGATPFPPRELPLAKALRNQTADGVEMVIRHDRRPAGVWVSASARPLPGENGAAQGGVIVFRDITEQKKAEKLLRELNVTLEVRIQERTAELVQVNKELSQQNQENEMFVYSVSHDLRSPLVNLQGFSKELELSAEALEALLEREGVPDRLRSQARKILRSDIAESINFIRTGVMRLSNIIDALLRLSRAGRVEYQWQHVDVAALVGRVSQSMQGTIDERAAQVVRQELPPAYGDPAALEQIFANLIGNALNYLDRARPGRIEIGALPPGTDDSDKRFVTYFVKDNGLGIPVSCQQKIFLAFQRAHPSIAPGEGMGLAIVRRAVERHGGKVWVESKESEGSTFFVRLPGAEYDR
jgi:PAS domain S-box-containing protein